MNGYGHADKKSLYSASTRDPNGSWLTILEYGHYNHCEAKCMHVLLHEVRKLKC